jgi:hypothetical protein
MLKPLFKEKSRTYAIPPLLIAAVGAALVGSAILLGQAGGGGGGSGGYFLVDNNDTNTQGFIAPAGVLYHQSSAPHIRGYGDDIHFVSSVTTTPFVWRFDQAGIANNDRYKIWITWRQYNYLSNKIPYEIKDGNGNTLKSGHLDQTNGNSPINTGVMFDGDSAQFFLLATIDRPADNIIEVALHPSASDASSHYMTMDAVVLEPTIPPPSSTPQVMDNGDPNFHAPTGWYHYAQPNYGGFNKDFHYASKASPHGGQPATWDFDVTSGTYDVYMTWPASKYYTQVPFNISTTGVGVQSGFDGTVDQRIKPRPDLIIDDSSTPTQSVQFQKLATITVPNAPILTVSLFPAAPSTTSPYGFVLADAVAIVRTGDGIDPADTCGAQSNEAVRAFIQAGYIDPAEDCNNDKLKRKEAVRLVVELMGGVVNPQPSIPRFDDVPIDHSYFSYIEEAASNGWIFGDNDCLGTHPCTFRPESGISREEFAHLLMLPFGYDRDCNPTPPLPIDMIRGSRYYEAMRIAIEKCFFKLNGANEFHPHTSLSLKEALIILYRIDQNETTYPTSCDVDYEDPPIDAHLSINVLSMPSQDTAVKNEKNIPLFRFVALGDPNEDVLVTQFMFEARVGSLLNMGYFTLWVDTDGVDGVDTILQDGGAIGPSTATLSFNDMAGGGFIVPAGSSREFEVHGSVANSLTTNDLKLQFATGSTTQSNYIEASAWIGGIAAPTLEGISTNADCQKDSDPATVETDCDILVGHTGDPTHWYFVNNGTLFVNKQQGSIRDRQLLGGSVGSGILHLQFTAHHEPVEVTDLQFTSSGSSANSVERLELYTYHSGKGFVQHATIGGCGDDDVIKANEGIAVETYCANMEAQQLLVPEGEIVDVYVRPRIKTDNAGGLPGQKINFFVSGEAVVDYNIGSGAVRARGLLSSNNLTANNEDAFDDGEILIGTNIFGAPNQALEGSDNVVVMSKITSITRGALSPPNGTNIPSGWDSIGQFTFTALSNSNNLGGQNITTLSGITFNVNATNVGLNNNNWSFYDQDNSSIKIGCTSFHTKGQPMNNMNSGSLLVVCEGFPPLMTSLNPGTSKTFVLEGNVEQTRIFAGNTSTLQISLQNFTNRTASEFTRATYSQTGANINWVDEDNNISNEFYWIELDDTVVNGTTYKG